VRALYVEEGLELRNCAAPMRAEDEALVRVLVAGICNTDIEILKGYMRFRGIPGHEFVGVVEQASNPGLRGKRVVGEINCVCHDCPECRAGRPHHCMRRTVLGIQNRDGAFAQYLTLPEENLHLVPDGVSDEDAVFVEPLAAAFRILEQITIRSDDRVIVLGDGKLGQLVARVMALASDQVLCIGKHRWKLDLLKDPGIKTATVDEPVAPGADVVVEATGSADGLRRAIELVRPEGTIVLKTTIAGESVAAMSVPVINEVRILGSRCGPFKPALEALSLGTVEVASLVSARFGLEQGVEAFDRSTASDVIKVLVHMEQRGAA